MIRGVDQRADSLVRERRPAHFKLEQAVRPNILSLAPYRCARDDFQEGVLLDANENALGPSLSSGSEQPVPVDALELHRYPHPALHGLRESAASLRSMPDPHFVFIGVGSDEVIDLIQRCFARPGRGKILVCPPTYGMYKVSAAINDLEVVQVPLRFDGSFGLDVPAINAALAADPDIALVFLCSPGNPTGSLLPLDEVRQVLDNANFNGLVIVDEAYIDFALEEQSLGRKNVGTDISACSLVPDYANLIVSQTLSKSFGLAAIRCGLAFAQPATIQVLNNTKAPYSISTTTAYLAAQALAPPGIAKMRENVRQLVENRDTLIAELGRIPALGRVIGGNDANFVMVEVLDGPGGKPDSARAATVYLTMAQEFDLVVRDRSKEPGCDGCLRISIGTADENKQCITLLEKLLA
ncbi:histidinol-phosphate transaminase [Malassezia cuniculi]|uniref:histidinol-phosphate transaminase n=1 Tax=Malassezia cuniculi TaxID=948313 RepID=A0AAF0J667_9BASI|nr:histidinol-phosphate transaminase [Malassezia cuniculi]